MDAQARVNILRLHSEHLQTLIEQLTAQLATVEHALAAYEQPTYAEAGKHFNETAMLSRHLADEITRLNSRIQEFIVKSLSKDAGAWS